MYNLINRNIKASRIFIVLACFFAVFPAIAGPPFNTDDPEPVEYKHWEYYISSMNIKQQGIWSGTLPHFEVNYGVIPDMQLHLVLPLNYLAHASRISDYGYADTEIGIKYRFVQETEAFPQIGTFPIFEVPTIENRALGNGKLQIYLPIWFQKSWGKFTTYGGGGYWINPGSENKNWFYAGWEGQYDIAPFLTLGGEVYNHTAQTMDSKASTGFNLGGFINFSGKFHLIFSIGHNLTNDSFFTSYAGLLWTI